MAEGEALMSFSESIRICFIKYFDFGGRARRSEFWFFNFFAIFTQYAYDFLFISQAELENVGMASVISFLLSCFLLIPLLAVGSRRLHDIGRSGWLQLLMITVIGIIPLIIWWIMEGTKESNEFGEPTKSD